MLSLIDIRAGTNLLRSTSIHLTWEVKQKSTLPLKEKTSRKACAGGSHSTTLGKCTRFSAWSARQATCSPLQHCADNDDPALILCHPIGKSRNRPAVAGSPDRDHPAPEMRPRRPLCRASE